jgi:hypothetical protein
MKHGGKKEEISFKTEGEEHDRMKDEFNILTCPSRSFGSQD